MLRALLVLGVLVVGAVAPPSPVLHKLSTQSSVPSTPCATPLEHHANSAVVFRYRVEGVRQGILRLQVRDPLCSLCFRARTWPLPLSVAFSVSFSVRTSFADVNRP
jgi:hypothetical protein